MSKKYRQDLMNMFEKTINADKTNPILGFHPNYVQSVDGKKNKLKIFGGNKDFYGSKICNDMTDGKGFSGGELPQTQEDYYSMRDSIRNRVKNYLKKQYEETTYGGELSGSIQTPELSNKQMDRYRKVEMERNSEPYLTSSNILEDERRQLYDKYGKRTSNLPITERIISPEVQMDVQNIKVMNDAEYDETHGRGMSGGKRRRNKKIKNPRRVEAAKKGVAKWVQHVKKMAELLGLGYMDAVKHPKVKETYQK